MVQHRDHSENIWTNTTRNPKISGKKKTQQLWCYDRPQDVKNVMHSYFGKRIAQGYKNAQEQLDIKENMLFFKSVWAWDSVLISSLKKIDLWLKYMYYLK